MTQPSVNVAAIVVAAGSGTRMGGVDKLFAPLAGRPLLAHTLAAFQECPAVTRVVLVLSPASLERGRKLVRDCGFDKVSQVCVGGSRRQDSVRLGLEALGPCYVVAVHDGARPLLTSDLIVRGLDAAGETGAAVPAIPIAYTVKDAGPDGTVLRTLDRSRLWAVQTPQVFRYDLLLRAHREAAADPSTLRLGSGQAWLRAGYTDDAAMLEALGLPVRLFPGSSTNLKITTPDDLRLAEALLEIETRNSQVEARPAPT